MAMPAARIEPRTRFRALLVGLVVFALLLWWPVSGPARAADPAFANSQSLTEQLEAAQRERQERQDQLNALLARIDTLEAEIEEVEGRLEELRAREADHADQADAAGDLLSSRVRDAYKRGTGDPLLSLFAADDPMEAGEQARVLSVLASRSQEELEQAAAARIRTRVLADDVAATATQLAERRAELASAHDEAASLLAAAERTERAVRDEIARVEAERRRVAAARAQQQRVSRAGAGRGGDGGAAASVTGGIACPVGTPRSYADTWGAPRSGGRRHKGTDILAPRGTPIYAYEDGAITRMNNSRLGGISLYLRGASGNLYYYTHLQGYVGGISVGQRVSAGQHIAFNGDSGNARGIPHLHFEVMPGGGGNVNPYPYVRRACG